jgi:molecular chaperone DnaK
MFTLGIDLGTTNSRMAVLDERGRPEVMENAEGAFLTPSVVYVGPDGVLVGEQAVAAGRDEPSRVIYNAKRWIGDPAKVWEIDDFAYTPVDVAARILRKLKDDFEARRGPVGRAVVTVPEHFDSVQRLLTIDAANQAGLEQVDLVNEPVASALMFILGEAVGFSELADEQTVLVYDLGGGTFDLSLVEYQRERITVRASSGDLKLGGVDWNNRIIEKMAWKYRETHGLEVRNDPAYMNQLHDRVETLKRQLSAENGLRGKLAAPPFHGVREAMEVTREQFEQWTADLVGRTGHLTRQLIADAASFLDGVDSILPVGGATRMPMIQKLMRKLRRALFDVGDPRRDPASDPAAKIKVDFAVAQGAALYGGILDAQQGVATGLSVAAAARLGGSRLTAVSTLDLGLMVGRGRRLVREVIFPRNTALPASRNVRVGTIRDRQDQIVLKVVEGERPAYRRGDIVLACTLGGLGPLQLPRGTVFDIGFFFEPNGLFQVIAKHADSGLIATASIQREVAAPPDDPDRIDAGFELTAAPPDHALPPPPMPGEVHGDIGLSFDEDAPLRRE